jgi:hypothetical protein
VKKLLFAAAFIYGIFVFFRFDSSPIDEVEEDFPTSLGGHVYLYPGPTQGGQVAFHTRP